MSDFNLYFGLNPENRVQITDTFTSNLLPTLRRTNYAGAPGTSRLSHPNRVLVFTFLPSFPLSERPFTIYPVRQNERA